MPRLAYSITQIWPLRAVCDVRHNLGLGGYCNPLIDGNADQPHDVPPVLHDQNAVAIAPWHTAIHQDVLDLARSPQTQRAHAVAGLTGADQEMLPEPQRVGDQVKGATDGDVSLYLAWTITP